ncbi:MAG: TolC family protein, partial [Cytophaga sp.]|nr:TolC family protein [Cytophaga sp.]
LLMAKSTITYHQQNLALEKAMAVPDLTLGAEFDKRGSFVDNATFFSVAMDLPFFHRNQGNIKAARIKVDQSALLLKQKQTEVENEVMSAYFKVTSTDQTIQSLDTTFIDKLQFLLQSVTENFQKKNISLLEFTDFYQSYKENILHYNQLRNERMQALEKLQFAVGKPILNL